MKSVPAFLFALVLAAPAFAADGDDPKPAPAPAPAPAPGPIPTPAPDGSMAGDAKTEAKKERKVDPAAAKAIERYASLIHLPASSGMKKLAARGEVDLGGISLNVHPRWTVEAGFEFDVDVPSAARETLVGKGVPEEAVDNFMKGNVGQTIGFAGVNAIFDAPGRNWEHYDLVVTQSGEDEILTLTPFDEKADADGRRYVFGKDGLLKSISVDPKAADDDQQMQAIKAMGGFEATVRYEKKGDRNIIAGRTLSLAGMEMGTEFAYYPTESGPWLVRQATLSTPQGDATFTFHDYVVDGKPVEGTQAATKKPDEAPAVKPAEKPADAPPAPPAPAPKDEPK